MDMIGKIRRLHFRQHNAPCRARRSLPQGSKPAHQKPTLSKNRRLIAIRLPSSRPQTPGQN